MNEIKAIIFDLDGTLIDSMYVWHKIDIDFLAERGLKVPPDYEQAIKTMHFETAAEYTIARFGFKETPQEIMSIWLNMALNEYAHNVRLKDNVEELLKRLKTLSVKIGIATSSKPILAEPVLKNNGVYDCFDMICYTSEVGLDKRHPDIYLLTAKKLGVKPEECIVFEDIIDGINGAKLAGMRTIAVYDEGSADDVEILKSVADKYIYSFTELL